MYTEKDTIMCFHQIPAGNNVPEDIYVIIEIPANSTPIKYEINKKTGNIFVDRFISTPMFYPCNYGYINNTLSLDGDPVDVLVLTPYPLLVGCVIHCRPVAMLDMTDESGEDYKIIAVPNRNITQQYEWIQDVEQLPNILLDQVSYFFKHYKDLEHTKWSKIKSWKNANIAKIKILEAFKRAQTSIDNTDTLHIKPS